MNTSTFKIFITLAVLTLFTFSACKKTETIYEEINFYTCTVKNNELIPRDFLTYVSSTKGSLINQVCYYGYDYEDIDILSKTSDIISIKKQCVNTDDIFILYLPFGGGNEINIDAKVGSIFTPFYSRRDATTESEEGFEDGTYVFECKHYDTIFNEVLHVKECNKYSYYAHFATMGGFDPYVSKCVFYYDVNRCIFVQVELWNTVTNELRNITKVVNVKSRNKAYFEELLNKAVPADRSEITLRDDQEYPLEKVHDPFFIGF